MAGRGRGRGRVSNSAYKPELFGLGKDDMKNLCEEPPPVFPPLVNKPLPLLDGEQQVYFLSIKREFRESWNASPYAIEYSAVKRDVERYTDRYTDQARADYSAAQRAEWSIDKTRFPKELLEVAVKRKIKPNIKSKKKIKLSTDIGKTLDDLEVEEKVEQEGGGEKSAGSEDEEGVNEIKDDEVYDEAEMEEGTDYGMSYFDPGEDYLDNEDDNLDDGPVY